MALCAKCGAQLAAGARSCPACGVAQAASRGEAGAVAAAGTRVSENVAGLLCYLVPLLASITFLVIDKRCVVKFHAVQSLAFFVCANLFYQLLEFALRFLPGAWDPLALGFYSRVVFGAYWSVMIGFWSFCLRKASQSERFKLPFLGNIAENIAGK